MVEIQCSSLIGSSVASSTSTAYPADYNGPFHVWTKTDGGAESAIHLYRWVTAWGEGILDCVKVGRYKNKWV